MTTPRDLTDDRIERIRLYAVRLGDHAMVDLCNRALGLTVTRMTVTEALLAICDAIDYAAGQECATCEDTGAVASASGFDACPSGCDGKWS